MLINFSFGLKIPSNTCWWRCYSRTIRGIFPKSTALPLSLIFLLVISSSPEVLTWMFCFWSLDLLALFLSLSIFTQWTNFLVDELEIQKPFSFKRLSLNQDKDVRNFTVRFASPAGFTSLAMTFPETQGPGTIRDPYLIDWMPNAAAPFSPWTSLTALSIQTAITESNGPLWSKRRCSKWIYFHH